MGLGGLLEHRDADFLLALTSFKLIRVIIFNFYQILDLVDILKSMLLSNILIIQLIPWDCSLRCIILI